MIHPVGTRVRTNSTIRSRFRDRIGTIVDINQLDFPYVEYGVNFSLKESASKQQIKFARFEAWFILNEIQKQEAPSAGLLRFPGFNTQAH